MTTSPQVPHLTNPHALDVDGNRLEPGEAVEIWLNKVPSGFFGVVLELRDLDPYGRANDDSFSVIVAVPVGNLPYRPTELRKVYR